METNKIDKLNSIKNNLKTISEIWWNHIWNYKYCSSEIMLDTDVESDYFSDILGYFQDSLDIIFESKKSLNGFNEKFSYTVSLLQAIFIQQDLIKEMLRVFKVTNTKTVLWKDPLYSINRDIRNELIGHPIRRDKEGKLVSTVLFNYQAREGEIEYFRFSKDNKFKSENLTSIICEIQHRHREFLEKYLSEVLIKLNTILDLYLKELKELENKIFYGDLSTILEHTSKCFNNVFVQERCYDVKSLSNLFRSYSEPERYEDLECIFYEDLKFAIVEKRKSVSNTIQQIQTLQIF